MMKIMESEYGYGLWFSVLINVLIILIFALSFIKPRGKWEWRSMGVYIGFLVALFSEMYGFPLTIYILTSLLGSRYPVLNPFSHSNGHLLFTFLGGGPYVFLLIHLISNGLIVAGVVLMGAGWKRIHRAGGALVTEGIYKRVRHPQYTGLLLISIGLMVQWPTLITLLLWPVMLLVYYRLSMREESEMIRRFGERYLEYKNSVPAFSPRLGFAKRSGSVGKPWEAAGNQS